ncbi:sterol desaturase family protein [Gammaproteobacteria bacterium]|jgi:sterol desaturase/sphingolipid hydroxylase (fatty acid hydroxylase superfamily)|nr:sterol desaturase family protein [Gammaproteobacteria bacterium]MDB2534625.1 sterol desaturase family protein [Gammaproteobacteria bacterium]MDC0536384.1 sterol desaturase family protein [Gammaproteobacteria bacterium]|tara:strand:- start:1073 stop:2323 length:1251 start_codon:yes stop_codon:yes gene_type:complete
MIVTDKSSIITFAVPVFLLLIVIEYCYGKYKGKNTYRLNDTFTSLSLGMISRYPTMLNLGMQSLIFVYISKYLNVGLLSVKNPLTWVIAFLLYDLSYYWMHRMHHEIKILWATHSVHHHGEDYNLATALRQTSTGWLWKWIFYLPMIILGIPGEVFITVAGINLVYQFWVHTEHIGHLGFLEKIFITPMNHGIHHAKNKEYIDANYGGVFIIWDRMFGTYTARMPDVEPVYGTVSALQSWNPIWANFQIFTTMVKDTIKTKKYSDKVKVWFSKTYWRPEDCIETKDPKEFYVKFNPVITNDIKVFSFLQLLFTSIVSGSVLFFFAEYNYNEIIVFGLAITLLSSMTGLLLEGKRYMYFVIFNVSIAGILAIEFLGVLNTNILSTNLLTSQLYVNIIAVSLLFIYQGYQSYSAVRIR